MPPRRRRTGKNLLPQPDGLLKDPLTVLHLHVSVSTGLSVGELVDAGTARIDEPNEIGRGPVRDESAVRDTEIGLFGLGAGAWMSRRA